MSIGGWVILLIFTVINVAAAKVSCSTSMYNCNAKGCTGVFHVLCEFFVKGKGSPSRSSRKGVWLFLCMQSGPPPVVPPCPDCVLRTTNPVFYKALCPLLLTGIFAYMNYRVPRTRKEIFETLIKGLQRLEYRGYDSAGKPCRLPP